MTNEMAYQNMSAADKFKLRYGNFKKNETKKEDHRREEKSRADSSIHSFSDLENPISGN